MSDLFTLVHLLTSSHVRHQWFVGRRQTVTMRQDDDSLACNDASKGHLGCCRCQDRLHRTLIDFQVDSSMAS